MLVHILRATQLPIFAWWVTVLSGCGGPSAPSLLSTGGNPTPTAVTSTPPAVTPTPPPTGQTQQLNLAGEYVIAFTAQNCDDRGRALLPAEFRTRRYVSHVEQNGSDVNVVLSGLPRMFTGGFPTLWGHIQSDGTVTLTNDFGNDQWDAIFEQVSSVNLLSILVDKMKITVSPEGLAGAGEFAGYFSIYDWSGTGWRNTSSECSSTSHSVTFARTSSR